MSDVASVDAAFFKPLVGSDVALADGEGNVVLAVRLNSVKDHPRASRPSGRRDAFSLMLTAPEPCGVDCGNYTLAHPVFGLLGPVWVVRNFAGSVGVSEALFSVTFC